MVSMALSKDDVLKIARLARLELSPEEIDRYGAQLSAILNHVEALKSLDVTNIEPTAHAVQVSTPFREDAVIPQKNLEDLLRNAPDREGNFFKVPKVIG
jgi:aspartyl-tRNA(Asn)/glutamyl-tRNA(Gln) amidotransferase subunit C